MARKGRREVNDARISSGSRRKRKHRRRVLNCVFTVFCALMFVAGAGYLTFACSDVPFIRNLRELYIETAMGTMTHQWLATAFLPESAIDEVTAEYDKQMESVNAAESSWDVSVTAEEIDTGEEEVNLDESDWGTQTAKISAKNSGSKENADEDPEAWFYETYWELDCTSFRNYVKQHPELTASGYDNILLEDFSQNCGILTVNGDPLVVLDTANNLLIVSVSGSGYKGKLAICKEADQVDLAKSAHLGGSGQFLETIAKNNNALVAINASRFYDPNGNGSGGSAKGSVVIDGVQYSSNVNIRESGWKFFGMKDDNLLRIMNYSSVDITEYRWGLECLPPLIINGQSVIDGSFGMGVQPRTCIGQAENGDFMMLVIDGRQASSVGTTVEVCTDIMLSYHAYQGMDLDGGASSAMWYNGKLITNPCSWSQGRYLPDAIIITPAE